MVAVDGGSRASEASQGDRVASIDRSKSEERRAVIRPPSSSHVPRYIEGDVDGQPDPDLDGLRQRHPRW